MTDREKAEQLREEIRKTEAYLKELYRQSRELIYKPPITKPQSENSKHIQSR